MILLTCFFILKETFCNDVIDFPGAWYMYADEIKRKPLGKKKLWGNGFNFMILILIIMILIEVTFKIK